MLDYTGKKLSGYINTKLLGINASRDFVDAIICFINTPADTRVLGISGLRGTGKTTGLLQAINKIGDFDNTVYILLTELDGQPSITYKELYEFISIKHADKKYIFIDEITYCKNFINGSATLCDDFASNGKKVVVCGTDSYALVEAKKNALYHRIALLNETFISYQESVRTVGIESFKQYLELGGLYKEDRITDIAELKSYISTSVIDNIMHTLQCNEKVTSLYDLEQYRNNPVKLKTVVYHILCAIVYSISNDKKQLSIAFITRLFKDNELYNDMQLNEYICSSLDIDSNIELDKKDVVPVLDALQRIHIVQCIENIYNNTQHKYYITNQSVFNQLALLLVNTGKKVSDIDKNKATLKGKQGYLFESAVINHVFAEVQKHGYKLFYYHDDSGREIDLIIGRIVASEDFSSEDKCILCEIKMTADIDTASVRSQWINSPLISIEDEVVARYIVYGGKTAIFESFVNENTYPPRNMTLEEIEEQNRGISLLNVEDFINNMQQYLSILERD